MDSGGGPLPPESGGGFLFSPRGWSACSASAGFGLLDGVEAFPLVGCRPKE